MTKETPFSALPELPLAAWQDTLTTIHMWSQIVGKIALARTPLINHYWNATLRMTPRGFRTLPLADPSGPFAFEFDLVDRLRRSADGADRALALRAARTAPRARPRLEAHRLGVRRAARRRSGATRELT